MSQANCSIDGFNKLVEPLIQIQDLANQTYKTLNATGEIVKFIWRSNAKLVNKNIYNISGNVIFNGMLIDMTTTYITLEKSQDQLNWFPVQQIYGGGGRWTTNTPSQKSMNFQFLEIPNEDAFYEVNVYFDKTSPTTTAGDLFVQDLQIILLGYLA